MHDDFEEYRRRDRDGWITWAVVGTLVAMVIGAAVILWVEKSGRGEQADERIGTAIHGHLN